MIPAEYLSSLFSLEGKVAVVIGGTGELCGAMAEGLAAAGAETVLVGRSEEKAAARLAKIESAGGRAYFEKVDVNSKASIQELLNNVIAKSGKIDILVNGAGVNSPTPIFDIEEDEFDSILNTNLKAVLFASQDLRQISGRAWRRWQHHQHRLNERHHSALSRFYLLCDQSRGA